MVISIQSPIDAPSSGRDLIVRGSQRSWRRFRANRAAMIAVSGLLLLAIIAVLGPVVLSTDPNRQDLVNKLQTPSGEHWLGTDQLGRDILARLVHGTRVSLVAALIGSGVGVLLGVPLGLLAGYAGGAVSAVLSSLANAVMSMPALLLAIAIVGVRGPGLGNAMIAVGVVLSPRFFRVARTAANSVRHETYIEASRAIGCPTRRILWRHLLPNASGPMLVQFSFAIGMAIVAEASLSFLGLGVRNPQASWGSMVQDSFGTIRRSTWGLVPPAVMITLTIFAFAAIGDAVRDALGRAGAE